jgi:5,10-methenyltetrahydrofolate synthetase
MRELHHEAMSEPLDPLERVRARKLQREHLLALRAAQPPEAAARVATRVAEWLDRAAPESLGFYWPVRGEPDLRAVVGAWLAADARRVAALPVIEGERMVFRAWTPATPMGRGAYGIAVPHGMELVVPAALLVPCVGYDAAGYRLGYGGGWYDRTLAATRPRPRTVGVAFEACRLASIAPEAHDVALDVVLSDGAGVALR